MTNPEGVAKARERVGRAPARERCSGVSFPVGSSFRRLVVPDSTNVYRLRPAFVPPSSCLRPFPLFLRPSQTTSRNFPVAGR